VSTQIVCASNYDQAMLKVLGVMIERDSRLKTLLSQVHWFIR